MVEMTDIVCLLFPLVMLSGSSLQTDVKSVKEAEKTGNFMEDEQWLSTISQYSRKIKHWNRFRDLSYISLTLDCILFGRQTRLSALQSLSIGLRPCVHADFCSSAQRAWRQQENKQDQNNVQ